MKTFLIISALAAAACQAIAGLSSGLSSATVAVAAESDAPAVAAHLEMPADFASVPIRVYTDEKGTALAYEETGQAVDFICQKAKDNGQIQVLRGGEISLSEGRGGSGWGISSWGGSQPAGSAEVYLLIPFTGGRTNIFEAGAEAVRFIGALDLPEKAHCDMGNVQLAVDNPEQYRGKLLSLISNEMTRACGTLAAQKGSVKVDGLEKPVMVRQLDERNVELYLDYSLSVTSDQ